MKPSYVKHNLTMTPQGLWCAGCDQYLVMEAASGPCAVASVAASMVADKVGQTIADREHTHGDYGSTSLLAQGIKEFYRSTRYWNVMSNDKKESLEMIATKLARILNGDPNHEDSWRDIAGYAELVRKTLTTKTEEN